MHNNDNFRKPNENDEQLRDRLKPNHYNSGSNDVIAFCMNHNLDFMQGNVIKYVFRYRNKNGMEDLKKAQEYLNRLIEHESTKQK